MFDLPDLKSSTLSCENGTVLINGGSVVTSSTCCVFGRLNKNTWGSPSCLKASICFLLRCPPFCPLTPDTISDAISTNKIILFLIKLWMPNISNGSSSHNHQKISIHKDNQYVSIFLCMRVNVSFRCRIVNDLPQQ